jgi:hypothetical protein
MAQNFNLGELGQFVTTNVTSNTITFVANTSQLVIATSLTTNTLTVSTNTATIGSSVYFVANGYVGIGTNSPAVPFVINGAATSTAPIERLLASSTTGGASYNWMRSALASGMSTGTHIVEIIGQSEAANNAGYTGFYYAGAGNANNYFTLGVFGQNDYLNVYPNGNIQMPYQPAFQAYLTNNGDQTYTNTTLPFNIVGFNRGGGTFNTSSYYYQVPRSGYYLFHCSTYGTASGGTATMYHNFNLNGSAPAGSRTMTDVWIGTGSGTVSICAIQGTQIIYCNAGDQISVYASAYNNSALYRIYTGTSMFQGFYLG